MTERRIQLYGRVILEGKIRALSGLHIGGSPAPLAIGGVDLPIIRNAVDQAPYIPGSSLKGKMRSLWEKATGAAQNRPIGQDVYIHACETQAEYAQCRVCQIYGSLGQNDVLFPTRIVVRDVPLDKASLKDAKIDQQYSEVKWEAAIDRVTSAATPRQIERVPAGAVFAQMQIVFNIYHAEDRRRFLDVLTALQLVEDDYLGGHGSRGSGRVRFEDLVLTCKSAERYGESAPPQRRMEALNETDGLLAWIEQSIPMRATGVN